MPFVLADLVIESVIRDGMTAVRNDPSIIDDVFSDMKRSFLAKKYGERELNKLKELFQKKEVSIVHAFHLVTSNVPCISIQLVDDTEDRDKAHLDDFEDDVRTPITDPEELADLVRVSPVLALDYDPLSGIVTIDDSVNLDSVYVHMIFEDAAGAEYEILGGIDNTPGQKKLLLDKNLTDLDISGPCQIKSSINFKQHEKRGTVETERILLGIHTKEPLLTKYLYILVKYFLLSRKKDLIDRDFQLSTFSGSDFTRNLDYGADAVFTRFLTVTGMIQNSWTSDKVTPIDHVDVQVLVEKDQAGNAELGLENSTVQVQEDEG